MTTTYTRGPLHLVIDAGWPFTLRLQNQAGDTVLSRDMPAHSSKDRRPEDAISARNMDASVKAMSVQMNEQAVADMRLYSAAAELADLAKMAASILAELPPAQQSPQVLELRRRAVALIRKADPRHYGDAPPPVQRTPKPAPAPCFGEPDSIEQADA